MTGDAISLAETQPQWDAITEEIACPLCGYNLRGLAEPRCPECGYHFVWKDLLEHGLRVHPFLFEHHPERGFRCFWKTALEGLNPFRFWRSVLPTHPPNGRRIVRYWVWSVAALLIGLLGAGIGATIQDIRSPSMQPKLPPGMPLYLWSPTSPLTRPPFPSMDFFSVLLDEHEIELSAIAQVTALLVIWPWLTAAALSIYRISMGRAKIRFVHVLRCVIHSFDGGI